VLILSHLIRQSFRTDGNRCPGARERPSCPPPRGTKAALWCADDDDVRGPAARHQRGRRQEAPDGRAAHPHGRPRTRRRPHVSPERERRLRQRPRRRGLARRGAVGRRWRSASASRSTSWCATTPICGPSLDACPFPAADLEARQLHVTYFSEPVGPERFASIDQQAFLPEEFRLGDRVLYLYAPDGLGRSKLAETLSKPRMTKGIVATTRNWNTVVKLAELTSG
jgi:hypothetical protein